MDTATKHLVSPDGSTAEKAFGADISRNSHGIGQRWSKVVTPEFRMLLQNSSGRPRLSQEAWPLCVAVIALLVILGTGMAIWFSGSLSASSTALIYKIEATRSYKLSQVGSCSRTRTRAEPKHDPEVNGILLVVGGMTMGMTVSTGIEILDGSGDSACFHGVFSDLPALGNSDGLPPMVTGVLGNSGDWVTCGHVDETSISCGALYRCQKKWAKSLNAQQGKLRKGFLGIPALNSLILLLEGTGNATYQAVKYDISKRLFDSLIIPDVMKDVIGACYVSLNTTHFLQIGGQLPPSTNDDKFSSNDQCDEDGDRCYSDSVHLLRVAERSVDHVSELPAKLNMARAFHGCGKARIDDSEAVIVAGGVSVDNQVLPSVEYLQLFMPNTKWNDVQKLAPSMQWNMLTDMIIPRTGAPVIGTLRGKLIIAGGLMQQMPQGQDGQGNYDSIPSGPVELELISDGKSVELVPTDEVEMFNVSANQWVLVDDRSQYSFLRLKEPKYLANSFQVSEEYCKDLKSKSSKLRFP